MRTKSQTIKTGVHVSCAGGIYKAVERAAELGCDCFQIFTGNPRGWKSAPPAPGDIEKFRSLRSKLTIAPAVGHVTYLINLASSDTDIAEKSVTALSRELKTASDLGLEYFVVHLGNHKGAGVDAGIENFQKNLNRAMNQHLPDLTVLLENMAGAGTSIGSTFEEILRIMNGLNRPQQIGVCLDTCHAFAAGYDLRAPENVKKTFLDFNKIIGLDRLKCIHANDCRFKLGEHHDRHHHIGQGFIGKQGFQSIVTHPKLKKTPFILETPKVDDMDRENMELLRTLSQKS